MSSRTTEYPIASLVEDVNLYPRHAVDSAHVSALALAIESGVELPAVVADRKSCRIVDGFHRCRAYRRILGPDAKVPVEFIEYINEAEMVRDAVARNARHGRRLDGIDKTRSIIMLRNVGMSDEEIGMTLHVPPKHVKKLAVRIATAPKSTDGTIPTTSHIALKRSVAHLEGARLTKKQANAHKSMPGTSLLLLTQQLTKAIENDLVNYEDDQLVAALGYLRELLQSVELQQVALS